MHIYIYIYACINIYTHTHISMYICSLGALQAVRDEHEQIKAALLRVKEEKEQILSELDRTQVKVAKDELQHTATHCNTL